MQVVYAGIASADDRLSNIWLTEVQLAMAIEDGSFESRI